MAAAETRKLLEQLMGDSVNSGFGSRGPQIPITDPQVCRSFLVGDCAHDLFTNTRMDLGPCKKVHNEGLRQEYQEASDEQKRKWGFEFDYQREMQRHINDCDKRINVAQQRLEKTTEEIRQYNALLEEIEELKENIALGLKEVQTLGELGMVNQAVQDYFAVQQRQAQKAEKERELRALADTQGPSGHQKLQVCDVCGAYLSRLDNDRRLADHFFGKMHLGFASMRRSLEKLNAELRGRAPPHREPEEDPRGGRGPWGGRGGGFGGGYGGGGRGGRGRGGGRGGGYGGGW